MKTIILASWCLLGLYTAILLVMMLFASAGSSSDRMASGYLMMLFIPLFILAGINLLPFKFTHILVLVVCVFPVVGGVLMLIASPIVKSVREGIWDRQNVAEANGSYYFKDDARRRLAADIAALDIAKLDADMKLPVPDLNNTGRENLTLFDFAVKQSFDADPAKLIACFEVLLKNGAKIDNGDKAHTPTHLRVLNFDPKLLKWFLDNGADPNAREADHGMPVLYMAVTNGYTYKSDAAEELQRVQMLLEHGADPNAHVPQFDERTIPTSILLSAAQRELWTLCNLLLDRGADTGFNTPSGWNVTKLVGYKVQDYTSRQNPLPDDLAALAKRLNVPVATDTLQ
ncbi:Ankyrin repeat-containing protein [Dyadobacter soli]|uniref:Ankyrin repeat-containing protein n=1 Tax=Dyadobacter soli TaxID=659014 RepID=A0A1G7W327_9BACT|nr:ankyrin repeat domain-containing protein [Dyadobacter soli]SDG65570.1 Ankyrin repeat-containing protein [Dyadobacter soli]